MPDTKAQYLTAAAENAASLRELDDCRAAVRDIFLDNILGARNYHATQQEIADHVGLSRQRISQFLKEAANA